MTEMLSDLESLYQTIEADPIDWGTYGVLADWYEEHGEDNKAEVIRWQIKYKRRAWIYHDDSVVRWEIRGSPDYDNSAISCIPAVVFNLMPPTPQTTKEFRKYPTLLQAQEALFIAYCKAKIGGWDGTLAWIDPKEFIQQTQ